MCYQTDENTQHVKGVTNEFEQTMKECAFRLHLIIVDFKKYHAQNS